MNAGVAERVMRGGGSAQAMKGIEDEKARAAAGMEAPQH